MGLHRCLIAAQVERVSDRALLEERTRSLAALYEQIAPVRAETEFIDDLRLLVAVLAVGPDAGAELPRSWGNGLPRGFDPVRASDNELRDLPTPLAAFGTATGTAAVVTAPGGVTSLYCAASTSIVAWSSHALAASWLATGTAAVDEDAIAELITWEFVGGDKTLIAGVRAIPQATRITITADGPTERCYWPPKDRWAPLDPDAAREEAPRALLAGLDRQLRGAQHAVVGLTGGLDSRTVAVALRELGLTFSTFTFVADAASASDAEASSTVASVLCVPHVQREIELWDDGHALASAEAAALWSDGTAPIPLGSIRWPEPLSHWVVGVGAEVGRAFYYRWTSPGERVPSRLRIEQTLRADMELDLGGVDPHVRRRLTDQLALWIDEAYETGHDGWTVVDVLYGEQRVRRWARGQAPRLGGAYVPALACQPLMQALASLPLEDRLNDGFARRFIRDRQPAITPPLPLQPHHRISPLRRRQLVNRLRGIRRALRLPPLGPRRAPWHTQAPWDEHRAVIDWLGEEVLCSPLVERAMGARWQREVRANFLSGEPHAAYLASWIAAPVALCRALDRVR